MKIVFLDRDGVINEDKPDYVKSWEEFSFLPGSKEAIKSLNDAKYGIIVVTNQAGIAKGLVSKITVEEINRRMRGEVEEAGGEILSVYVCPHQTADNCQCRKPKTLLFKQAIKKFKINCKQSFLVGNAARDIEAGRKIGCQTILVMDKEFTQEELKKIKPRFTADSLKEAVSLIIKPRTKKQAVDRGQKTEDRKQKIEDRG